MSIQADNREQEINVKELLETIALQLKLLNARIEEGFETGIELEDLDDGDS